MQLLGRLVKAALARHSIENLIRKQRHISCLLPLILVWRRFTRNESFSPCRCFSSIFFLSVLSQPGFVKRPGAIFHKKQGGGLVRVPAPTPFGRSIHGSFPFFAQRHGPQAAGTGQHAAGSPRRFPAGGRAVRLRRAARRDAAPAGPLPALGRAAGLPALLLFAGGGLCPHPQPAAVCRADAAFRPPQRGAL